MPEKPDTKNTGDHGTLLKQALRALEQMKQKLVDAEARAPQPIAIVGMGCRFPGDVRNAESFWEMLSHGREAISEVPEDRWDVDEYYDPDPSTPGKMVSRYGGFLSDIDQFDAAFFGIAPREAAMMDPQQRLLLEVAWEALETAGIAPRSLTGSRTGMYLGIASGDYAQLQLHAGDAALLDVHYASGNAHSIASGRLSYLLGLKGPSISIDTACSSSLVAVHLACQALRAGECALAIAGGVNIILAPETTVALSHAHMMSPDGRSKAFDDCADGFARAEGCGLVLLKPLDQAIADGDPVLAVIRGTALNQDGASSSLTAPHGPSQEELMRHALEDAGRTASQVSYVETHGTGTSLGDPIELRALGAVYGAGRKPEEPLLIGSLKTNFGHMEAAAGVGGLIKLVLALQHGEIPAHLQVETPTRHVAWGQLRLALPSRTTPWPALIDAEGKLMPRLGAVSSFGFSGTNAHLIVEQAPILASSLSPVNEESEPKIPRILPLSASSEEALSALMNSYSRWLCSTDAERWTWSDVATTAAVGRDHLRCRVALVANSKKEAAATLEATPSAALHAAQDPSVCFLFTGQGSEYRGMGLELLQNSPVFRTAIERLESALDGRLGCSIASIWTADHGELEKASLLQPALFAFGWALSELWRSWGVEPTVVLGHSLGEYVAATVAGVLSPEDGIRLVAARGLLTEQLAEPGGMIAVVSSNDEVRRLLSTSPSLRRLNVAAVNGPASVVVSGRLEELLEFEAAVASSGHRYKRLRTTHGFHSRAMESMLDAFAAEAAKLTFRMPDIRWISNVTGEVVGRQHPVDAHYWRQHLRDTVEFERGLKAAGSAGAELYLELGAQPQLLALAEANSLGADTLIASIRKGSADGEWRKLLLAASQLYARGVNLDWRAMTAGNRFQRVPLPTYPFQRKRFWFTDHRDAAHPRRTAVPSAGGVPTGHPLLATRLRTSSTNTTFQSELLPGLPAFLGEHVVMSRRILPGAAYLEMGLSSLSLLGDRRKVRVVDVEFREPCVFDKPRLLETTVSAVDSATGRCSFEIASSSLELDGTLEPKEDAWTLHAAGFLQPWTEVQEDLPVLNLFDFQSRAHTVWTKQTFYERFEAIGLEFGPAFRSVRRAWGDDDRGLVEFELPAPVEAESALYMIHPVALDACLQAAAALANRVSSPALPASLDSFCLLGDPRVLGFATAKIRKRNGRALTVDIAGFDAEGTPVLFLAGLTLVEASQEQYSGWLHEVVWEPAAFPEKLSPPSQTLCIRLDAGALNQGFAQSARRNELLVFQNWLEDFDQLCAACLAQSFADGGFALTFEREFHLLDLLRALSVEQGQHRLARRFLQTLCQFGYLEHLDADRFRVREHRPIEIDTVALRLRSSNYPEMAWTERCIPQILPLLRGEVDAVNALFAEDGRQIAKRLYRESVSSRILNSALAAAAAQAASQLHGKARVLEVGGGTGASTSYLIPALEGAFKEYVFTDLGAGFVSAAQREFSNIPGLRFQTLDLERDPAEQGLDGAPFDIVIASNVLHATADLRATLHRVASLLAPGGVLLIAETLNGHPWIDLTVGFTDGWWRFTDHDLRPDYPLVDKQTWISVLNECGFKDILVLPEQDNGLQQCVFAAIRQVADAVIQDAPRSGRQRALLITESALAAGQGLAGFVSRHARLLGAEITLVSSGTNPRTVIPGWLEPGPPADESDENHFSIFYLPSETAPDIDLSDGGDLPAMEKASLASILEWTQAILASDRFPLCRFWVVTRGAFGPQTSSPFGASFAGFVRTVRSEYPDFQAFAIDLGAVHPAAEEVVAERLWRIALQAPRGAIQLARHGEHLYVPRLVPYHLPKPALDASASLAECQTRRLHLALSGLLEDLVPSTELRQSPGAFEVEVKIQAAAINFHEVLSALQADSAHDIPPGGECAGIIVRVGEQVPDFRPGDEVVAIGSGLLSDFATLPSDRVWKKPHRLSLEESATLLIPFLTARWSLEKIARVQPGERVLVHAGAGGVGLAAIQEAKRLGARVFATAGSHAKREFLRASGIEGVFDSRSADFEAEVLMATGFQGVDVVLNSLGGDLIAAGLRSLAPRGRFLELGEQTALTEMEVTSIRPDVAYHRIHLRAALGEATPEVREILASILADAEEGILAPLPFTVFPLAESAEAFRFMAAAKHIGRVLLTPGSNSTSTAFAIRKDSAYLVTGGLTGLGRLTVEWLARQGAGCVLALGRRDADEETQRLFSHLTEKGTLILTASCDVSQRDELATAIQSVPSLLPLRGVFHAAGVLDDASLPQQTRDRFHTVLAAKVAGAWNLHSLTLHHDLDCFVLYSSAAGVFGARGQANHAAANADLDALAHFRRDQLGLTALSINWGTWSGTGAAVRHSVVERSERAGAVSIAPEHGIRILELLLQTDAAQVLVSSVNWKQWAARTPAAASANADLLFHVLGKPQSSHSLPREETPHGSSPDTKKSGQNSARHQQNSWRQQLLSAPPEKQQTLLEARLDSRIRGVLALGPKQPIDPGRPLQEYGLDSLLSIELRNALSTDLDIRLPATTLFDHPTLASLTKWLFHDVLKLGTNPDQKNIKVHQAADVLQEVSTLSDEEVERLFQQKMAGMRP